MQATMLVRVAPVIPVPSPAMRSLITALRQVRLLAGFLRWQTFRAMDVSGALLFVIDWESEAYLEAGSSGETYRELTARAAEFGFHFDAPEVLRASFDRCLSATQSVATLLRVSRTENPSSGAAARDSALALQAMAAPGSIRLHGARTASGRTAICLIDFDTEDGIWHFLDSPIRKSWSLRAERAAEAETWALNLPRLEARGYSALQQRSLYMLPYQQSLSVQLQVSEDNSRAEVCLQGRVDAHGSALSEKFFRTLIHDGCRVLEVDVSGLAGISSDAVAMLTRTARHLKQHGGQFVLVDNEMRVRRVTRSKHLEESLR